MDPLDTIIHWNCNGLKTRIQNGELTRLVRQYTPAVVCLQHTNHNANKFDQYHIADYYQHSENELGTAIYVHKNISYNKITIANKYIQTSAVELILNRNQKITIFNMYNQPSCKYDLKKITNVIKNHKNVLIVGDFNSHNPLWDTNLTTSDRNGKIIEKIVNKEHLCIRNDPESPTYYSRTHNSFSSIDLSICSNSITHQLEWSISDDDFSSDHYPIIISLITNNNPNSTQRFNTEKANWPLFTELTNAIYPFNINQDHNEINENLTKFIIEAAKKTMPMTSNRPVKKAVPWWNEELNYYKTMKIKLGKKIKAINSKFKQSNLNRIYTNKEKLIELANEFGHTRRIYNRICAIFKRSIIQAKKQSWEKYIGTITERTPMKKIWTKFRKINGNGNNQPKHPLKHNGEIIHDDKKIADIFGTHLQKISSDENYDQEFLKKKRVSEKEKINFTTNTEEYYNDDINMEELEHALKTCKKTAPGEDLISFEMIKHLGKLTKNYILKYFNKLWKEKKFPEAWRHALVLPIPKPAKDPSNPTNYRPISLTSSMCKLMEKIVNNRLTWYLKKNRVITPTQFGSLKKRSTIDSLANIEHYIRKNYKEKKITGAIFFDIEKAYDTTWRHRVLKQLHEYDLRGNLPIFISNFMKQRTFQVKFHNTLSEKYELSNGLPQGSVLSGTLFIIGINNIVKQLPARIRKNLYVDDFAVYYASRSIRHLQRILSTAANKVNQWTKSNGFKLALSKTQGILFYRNKKWLQGRKIKLKIENHNVEFKNAVKFLGVYLDTHLNFKTHIAYTKSKAISALNLLKKLSNTKWGAKRKPLTNLFKATVMSKINYGAPIYGSATQATLKKLHTVQTQGLRLCTGAFKSSPNSSVICESGEIPMDLENELLTMRTALRIIGTDSPTRKLFKDNTKYANARPPFPSRAKKLIENTGIHITIYEEGEERTPPWRIRKVNTCKGLYYLQKKHYAQEELKIHTIEHLRRKNNAMKIFTDGSKMDSGVGFAVHSPIRNISHSLPKHASIFTAEIMAIMYATLVIKDSHNTHHVICTDSRSSVEALSNYTHPNPLVRKTKMLISNLAKKGKHTQVCWIPSHTGLKENDRADELAKKAVHAQPCNESIPVTDYFRPLKQQVLQEWQRRWEKEPQRNKLKKIKKETCKWHSSIQPSRQLEVILTRLRIGHTRLTHGYLMQMPRENKPKCTHCNVPLTINHIFNECRDIQNERTQHFGDKKINEILQDRSNFSMKRIADFLKKIKIFEEI